MATMFLGWRFTDILCDLVYQIVVEPRFVDKAIREVLKSKPKVLPLWDPMGALA